MSLTSAQVVALACQVAKCPGFTVQAGQYMNVVLRELWLHRDLKVNRKTQSLVVKAGSNGPFSLEADYQRTYDLFYVDNGLPHFLRPAKETMYDAMFKDSATTNYPYLYTTDIGTQAQAAAVLAGSPGAQGQFYIFPQSSGQIALTHRYMQQQPDIATPELSTAVPWFIDQDYLIMAISARLMQVTDDDRLLTTHSPQALDEKLRIHLIMAADDEQQIGFFLTLDPWRYRNPRSAKSTKRASY